MANPIASLFVEFRASLDKFHDDLGAVSKEIRAFDKDMKPVTDRLTEFGNAATKTGVFLMAAVTAPVAAIAGLGIAFNAMQEKATIGFTTLLGSGQEAKAFLNDLKDFAAVTPFEFQGLVQASQKMLAMGFAAGEVKPMLTAIGDAAAGMGRGQEGIDRITNAIIQMKAKHKVSAEEMTQQLGEIIPAWEFVAAKIGVDVPTAMKMAEKGAIDVDTAIQGLIEGMRGRFGGEMQKQAMGWSGLMSTIKDESKMLAGELTEGLFNALKGPAASVASALHEVREGMKGWSDESKAAIGIIAGIGAAAGPAVFGIGELAFGINNVIMVYGRAVPMITKMNEALAGMGLVSMGAIAGVVALGAAIGVIVGSLINWILKITGLEQAFDGFLASMARWIPGLSSYVTGNNAVADATNNLTKAQRDNIAEFAKHGVTVDAARLNDSAYLASLAQLSKQWAAHTADIKRDYGPTMTDYNKILAARKEREEAAAKAAKEHAAEVKRVTESFNDALKPADDLNGQLSILVSRFSSHDIITMYGKKIIDAANAQREHGYEVTGTIAKLEKMARAAFDAQGKVYDLASALEHIKLPAVTMPSGVKTELPDTGLQAIGKVIGVPELGTLPKVGLPPVFGPTPTASTEVWDKYKREGQKAIDQVVGDMSHMFIDQIGHGDKKFWEAFKNLGNDALAGIFDTVMTKILHSFLDPFSQAIGQLLNGLTSGLSSALSGIGKSIAGAFGFGGGGASAVKGAAGAVSSGSGGVGSALSGALNSTGIVGGLISGGLSAAGSLLGSMRLEGTMNAVEANTRFAAIHLGVMINDFFWPMRTHTEWILHHAGEHTNQLDAIYNVLSGRGPAGGGGVASAAVGNNITLNVNVTAPRGSDAASWGDALISRINEALITDRGGLRTNIALVATQTNGIVSTVPAT